MIIDLIKFKLYTWVVNQNEKNSKYIDDKIQVLAMKDCSLQKNKNKLYRLIRKLEICQQVKVKYEEKADDIIDKY